MLFNINCNASNSEVWIRSSPNCILSILVLVNSINDWIALDRKQVLTEENYRHVWRNSVSVLHSS
jgi:hypothetical protein